MSDLLADGDGPLLRLLVDGAGRPTGAIAALRIAAPVTRVWQVVRDVEALPARVPMVHRVRRDGDRLDMQLRFRIAVFSAKFGFVARERHEEGRWIELDWESGEPRGIRLRFELQPLDDGAATRLSVAVSFDVLSLGWLASYFLRHHPEIQYGVFPGSALVLLDAIGRGAAEGR